MMKKSILVALALGLACGLAGIAHANDSLRYLGSVTMKIGLIDKVAPVVEKQQLDINADASGATSAGVNDVLAGKAEIVGSGGSFNKEAITRGITPTLIGSDILAFAVHSSNPVKELSREQLKGIYTGKIKNWSEVGGKDMRIVLFTMDTISAGYEIVKEVMLDNENFAESIVPMRVPTMVAENVNKVPEAIGFCSLCFIQREPNAKPIDIGGQSPSPSNPKYPLVRPLYWGTKGTPSGTAKTLIDFILSDDGQAIVKQSFVGVADTQKLFGKGN